MSHTATAVLAQARCKVYFLLDGAFLLLSKYSFNSFRYGDTFSSDLSDSLEFNSFNSSRVFSSMYFLESRRLFILLFNGILTNAAPKNMPTIRTAI